MSFFKDQSDAGRKKRRRVLKISIYEHPFDYSTENAELLSSEKEFDKVLSEMGFDMTYRRLIEGEGEKNG